MTVGPERLVVGHLVIGPAGHGVVRFAEQLAAQLGGPVVRLSGPDDLAVDGAAGLSALSGADVVLAQYTDGLDGRDTTSAAARFVALREQIDRPVVVTMHRLPDPIDDPVNYRRRAAGYRAVMDAVDAVIVSSQHEARLFARFSTLFTAGHAGVVPLPIDRRPAAQDRPDPQPELAVLGFLAPGKGHDDALAALDGAPAAIGLTAIGRPADGHHDLATALTAAAAESGHWFRITGFLADDVLIPRLRQVAVPIAPSRTVSTSINTWISAGRRPLVAAGPYTRELAERCPDAVLLYEPDELPGLIREAFMDPDLTWLDDEAQVGPSSAEAAADYLILLAEVAGQSRTAAVTRH
jgi:glycosyltransferase involved in cell wall biosynthesis